MNSSEERVRCAVCKLPSPLASDGSFAVHLDTRILGTPVCAGSGKAERWHEPPVIRSGVLEVKLFLRLADVLRALVCPSISKPSSAGPRTLEDAFSLVAWSSRRLALTTASGLAVERPSNNGAPRRYFAPFRWAVEGPEETREVLVARDLWPAGLDEWRDRPTMFRQWDSRAVKYVDVARPTMSETVMLAAHGRALVDVLTVFQEEAKDRASRASSLVLHGVFSRSSDRVSARVTKSGELVIQYPRPWGWGGWLHSMRRAIKASMVDATHM